MATSDSKQSWASGMTFYVVYVSLITAIGPLHFGFHLAELNAPQEVLTCGAKSSLPKSPTLISHLRTSLAVSKAPSLSGLPTCIPMNLTLFGLVSSIYTLGGLIGALSIGLLAGNSASPDPRANAGYLRSLASKLPSPPSGRLAQMRLTTLCFVLGPLVEALAPSIWLLAIGRFISGIGSGAALVVVPIYISEIAPPSRKGLFGALTQVMTNVGILLAQVLGYFLSYGNMWRVVFAVAGAVGVVQVLGLFFVPESPKWLAEMGQVEKARRILRRVRGRGVDVEEEVSGWDVGDQGQGVLPISTNTTAAKSKSSSTNPHPEEEESLLRNPDPRPHPPSKPHPSKDPVTMLGALLHPSHRRAILAVIGVMVAQQLCGINAVVMYSQSTLHPILPTSAGLITVAVGAVNLVVTIACAPLADRLGRKTCLLLSIAGMGTNALLLAVGIVYHIKILSAVVTLLFVASFAVGLGPVPFILASELVGPEAVGAAQSWALAGSWVATFVVAQFFPPLNEALGGKVYFLFAGLALLFALFVTGWVPESGGKRDADEVWGRVRRED